MLPRKEPPKKINKFRSDLNVANIGAELYDIIVELYPICRSITGDGIRETLKKLSGYICIDIYEVETGTQVFDWTVPKEWNIREAYIKDPDGEKIVDFKRSNLHILNYSIPVHENISLQELKKHLFTLPEKPDWVPYKTSYYEENWGFCISHNQFLDLRDGAYEVYIDSTLESGYLTYGEFHVPGSGNGEVLISCHICHPSLCNDNLSGLVVSTLLARHISQLNLRYSYRFLYIPGTIGSITWLSKNKENINNIKHGLVVSCLGDRGKLTYKKSRRGDSNIDRIVQHVLKHSGDAFQTIDFYPYGYDERQFCSPGFNLPIGCLMRSIPGSFPEYHTSADNLEFVYPDYLADSFMKILSIVNVIENNSRYLNLNPNCEPQLGRRGLYQSIGGHTESKQNQMAMLWVLNMSDGQNSLLDIAERANLDFEIVETAASALSEHGLLKEV